MKKYIFSTPLLFLLLLLRCSAVVYMPKDDIAVNCGSSGGSTDHLTRSWIGDQNSKYSPVDDNSESSSSRSFTVPQRSEIDKVPYSSVRLSSSHFTYSFPVTVGPKFIRLHFYPFNYTTNFSRTDAYFSVTSGSYTLLRNFSAALTADYLKFPVFFREFCVNVEDNEKWLNLTFTPTTNQPNAYAFINGIEVVSMPVNLYYGDLKDLTTETTSHLVKFLGDDFRDPYTMSTTVALETMYRINVGGHEISPVDDTGVYRTWEGPDDKYVSKDPDSSLLPWNITMQFHFTMVPDYTAPDNVYQTARTMGMNGTVNEAYNLTWSFQVDTNFYYLVRLHFCEILHEINMREDRSFRIFIATIMAEERADIIRWTGSKAVPYYRDYIVDMFDHQNKKVKLDIALHPGVWGVDTRYADAILNGLEIFKISNDTGNLAGPNPPRNDSVLPSTPLEPSFSTPLEPSFSKSGNKAVTIASIVGSVVSGIVVISLIVVCALWLRRSKQKLIYMRGQQLKAKNEAPGMMNRSWKEQLKSGDGNELPIFDFGSILVATDKFSSNNRLGQGGFGPVYKGKLQDGKDVAVKRLCSNSGQGIEEFKNEITLISKLQHRNLVRLVGCCIEEEEKILIYEYLPNKSLDTFLFDPIKKMELNWGKRFQIIQGIARGLLYLHRDSNLRVIHRDLKASNILLDQNFNPKISDFGLARMFQGTIDIINTRKVAGTLGYMAPEYVIGGIFSEKSDVYSFGVLLLEVVSTKKNTSFRQDEGPLNLVSYTWELWREGRGLDLLDGAELESCCLVEVEKCIQVGLMCLQDQPADRPLMSSVIQMLSGEADLSLPKEPTFFTFQITSMMIEAPIRLSTAVVVSYSDIEGR